MDKTVKFLEECNTFYLATVEGDQPRVRPFGAIMEWEGKVYICTNNTKDVFKQMMDNPRVEIAAFNPETEKWIRICARVVSDDREEAKEAMLEANPVLKNKYCPDDNIYEVLYLSEANVKIYNSFEEIEEEFVL